VDGSASERRPTALHEAARARALTPRGRAVTGGGRHLPRSGLWGLGALLLGTAGAALAMGFFLYGQLRTAEAAAAVVAARNAELEQTGQALGEKVEGLERREKGLTQLLDELDRKQHARDAALAERAATVDVLQSVFQPFLKRGDALLQEAPDALELHLAEAVLFVPGTSRLTAGGARMLVQMGDGLTDTRLRVEVLGRGPSFLTIPLAEAAEQARLAAERASRVGAFLVGYAGLTKERVSSGVYAPVRRKPNEPPLVRHSSLGLRFIAPPVAASLPGKAAVSAALPTLRP
jgi:hypothetical protein